MTTHTTTSRPTFPPHAKGAAPSRTEDGETQAADAAKQRATEGKPPLSQGGPELLVDIITDDGDWSAFPQVETIVEAAAIAVTRCGELNVGRAEVAIALSSDEEVAALNATYRGKHKATNVLSFPPPTPRNQPALDEARALGDIIIARETVLAEAESLGISPSHHLSHLVVHGLLHLLGYDHETDEDARAMEALEVSILANLQIADPYADSDLISQPVEA